MNLPHTSLVGIPRGGRVELTAAPSQRGLLVTQVLLSGTSYNESYLALLDTGERGLSLETVFSEPSGRPGSRINWIRFSSSTPVAARALWYSSLTTSVENLFKALSKM
jgi:hypothetical protein